ncbi:cAMP-binding domain of CRP or a regulatory subunit of cAMP-dependent protein kinases [Nitrosospira sp. Nsp14]|uniref:Crp/Fnr family transcriptional regulator n=1 Tax=Nitrosospira sp. Nsp14 TaxID=1855333 RepID=UPI0008EE897D|nr:Crp/Fnr family transcriptional regulator [Nitrosospira sp. Nsp14]SFH61330.1 cAMP-binding domain of CRP or a regulatory subunit of cAMP-dependent protein kinases [Nitrosospira sp. Nsp14]
MRLLHSPTQNKILGALPDEEYRRLLPFLELVDMPLGQVIHEPGTRPSQLYFPATCIVARIYELRSGITRRVSMTGNEGVTDIFLLLGCDSTAATVIVQNPGYGYRIKAKILKQEFEAGGPLQQLLLRFSQALLCQTEQTAVEACQSVEQKLCRFFLMILDRLATDSIAMTHEFVSNMLGVRRESVSVAAHVLQLEGAIQYRRGHITLLNRKVMEDRVSEGYVALKKEYDLLLLNRPCLGPVSC